MENRLIDTYAVMGNPIAHSKSPLIHAEFAKQTGQSLRYVKIEVPLDDFIAEVKLFAKEKGKGLNITVPFKQQAFELVTSCSKRAQVAKAVNTIKIINTDEFYGDNTDGVGLIRDITLHHHFQIKDKSILILGAGGAVRGILQPILEQSPKRLVLANRTLITAETLAAEFSPYGPIEAMPFDAIQNHFDLIINGTSLSLHNEAVPLPGTIITENTFCYDLMYGQEPTPFLKWALSNGALHIADGIGMLVEQAAESFYLWRGIRPETTKIIELLKQPL